jgi:hypothetical protein
MPVITRTLLTITMIMKTEYPARGLKMAPLSTRANH